MQKPTIPNVMRTKKCRMDLEAGASRRSKETVAVGNNAYMMEVGGLGAALMRRQGWVPGEGLGRANTGIQEPVEFGTMGLGGARRLGVLPRFYANWAQPGDPAEMHTRSAGSVREDSYPFNIINETAPAWDYAQCSARASGRVETTLLLQQPNQITSLVPKTTLCCLRAFPLMSWASENPSTMI